MTTSRDQLKILRESRTRSGWYGRLLLLWGLWGATDIGTRGDPRLAGSGGLFGGRGHWCSRGRGHWDAGLALNVGSVERRGEHG